MWEYYIHHILNFCQVRPQFDALFAEISQLLYRKSCSQNFPCFFCQTLYSNQLLIKSVFIYY